MKNSTIPFLAALITLSSFLAFSVYNNGGEEAFYTLMEGNSNWKKVKKEYALDETDILNRYKDQLGLGPKDVLVKHRVSHDNYGNEHLHYQHYHAGIKVVASQIIFHKKNDEVYLVNGTIVENIDKNREAKISKNQAFEIAKDEFPNAHFMWENPFMENWVKKMKRDKNASFFPALPLVFYQKKLNKEAEQYDLAYEVDIHTFAPEQKAKVYVDALTGDVIHIQNHLHTGGDHEGTAETRYHGTRQIITDSIGQDSFVLVDSTRGPGIFTLNANQNSDFTDFDLFYDDDNYWNNVNAMQDEVATDVHWGAEMTYDFYSNYLGREGMSGDSVALISFVHVDKNWTNATWNGFFASFGDGNAPNTPLTAIDVVGHEFAHGLTDYTANLVYMDEFGALNESFSDIFGAAQEFIYDPETSDWLIGEDFIAGGGFRSMSDPKSKNHPDTYKGLFWFSGAGDNGGVHTNSSIQNHWFYLLSEGGEGLNDNGHTYSVDSIGLEKAIQIAYGNLNNYLTESSEYIDASLGSIQAAIDIYGDCSTEVEQVINAWYAVGVGNKFERNDISLIELVGPEDKICGVSDSINVSVLFTFNNCDGPLLPGSYIPFEYSLDFGNLYLDTIYLTDTIFSQDTILHTFETNIEEFSVAGTYELNISSKLDNDNIESNNHLRKSYRILEDQNFDFAYNKTLSPVSGCYLSDGEKVGVRLQFLGCDSIAAGEMVEIQYSLNEGEWISDNFVLDTSYYADQYLDFYFENDSLDLTAHGTYSFEAKLIYGPDTLLHNNSSELEFIENPLPLQKKVKFHFDGVNETPQDSFYVNEGSKTTVSIEEGVGFKSTKGLAISGSDGFQQLVDNRLTQPNFQNVWSGINRDYVSENCVCADLTNSDQAKLKFRVNQTYSPIYNDIFGKKLQYSSALRVTANGKKLSPTLIPVDNTDNPYLIKSYNLTDYLGGTIEICFQTHTLLDAENDPYGIGDNVYIDEVIIDANTVSSTNDIEWKNSVVFPSPTQGQFSLLNNWEEPYNVEIWDINGNLILRKENFKDGEEININNYSAGIYIIHSISTNKRAISKVILQ